jgi:hypothetical protein
MRERFVRWVMARSGIALGQVLPWWIQGIVWALWPVYVSRMRAASGVYNHLRHAVKINGVWLHLFALRYLTVARPDMWYRVIQVENGVATMEARHDDDMWCRCDNHHPALAACLRCGKPRLALHVPHERGSPDAP